MSNNEADFMYNWIRKHSGRVKTDDVTTNDSNAHLDVRGSNDNKNNKGNETNTNNNTIQSNEYSSKESDTK